MAQHHDASHVEDMIRSVAKDLLDEQQKRFDATLQKKEEETEALRVKLQEQQHHTPSSIRRNDSNENCCFFENASGGLNGQNYILPQRTKRCRGGDRRDKRQRDEERRQQRERERGRRRHVPIPSYDDDSQRRRTVQRITQASIIET
eukprot:805180_1